MSNKIFRTVVLTGFIAYALVIVYPLIWLFMNGLKTNKEFFLSPFGLPVKWMWKNYASAWNSGIGHYFFNSVFVTVISVLFVVFLGSMASYGLSRFHFKGANVIVIVVLSGIMISPQVSLISLYKMLQMTHLYNSYWAMIVPYVAYNLPFSIFLMRSYFLGISREIEESAIIDGCSTWKVFVHMIVPIGKPILVTSALLAGMNCWNEFMFALVFVENSGLRTIPVGLMNLRSTLTTQFGILLSGFATSMIPMIVIFIIFQKQFTRGLSSGSIKG
jgi:raffinose/stachyose/melibiose transport system permease protein